ncbi:fasciclin domain-containing protein [Aquabacterium sp.]|uniref:fasciclin domain-containing protein n=1 Tax=Aquabacterium sp. TaxID=1872578 RepID=UPI0035C6B71C
MTFRPSRRLALTSAALVALLQFAGCATTAGSAPASLQALAAQKAELSTFNKLAASAGLGDVLSGGTAVTVFAPTDEAFKAVPAATLDKLAKDPAALKALLLQHVLAGKVMSADIQAGSAPVTTLAGGKVTVSKAGDFVTVDEALVTQADGVASNGVLHVIDRVLTAPKK